MKGLSVVVTILLFVVAVAVSDFLKKAGTTPQETVSVASGTLSTNQGPQKRVLSAHGS